MTKATEYLAENAQYISDKTQIEIIAGLSDAEFDAVLRASDEIGLGDDAPGALVPTSETLEDWIGSRTGWRERGKMTRIECAGLPALLFEDFQMLKGQPRVFSMAVLDLGERRLVVR